MAWETPLFILPGVEASGDLSALQYRAMLIDSNGRVAQAGAGVAIAGILQDDPDAIGKSASVMVLGVSKAEVGAATTAGGKLMSDGNGRLINWTTGNHAVAIGLQAGGASGEKISVLLLPLGVD
jgi:hypothetical protein